MCGIAGFSGNYGIKLLDAMTASVAHRGPDDHDTLLLEGTAGRVGLGHRRLSIIDLSASAHEPMGVSCLRCGVDSRSDPPRGRWLIYNGEIYNYRELREELIARGHDFFSKSDTEVLLHLYAEEGTAMLARINGMFAFALFDGAGNGNASGMTAGGMLLARDGFGVKPLYYATTPRGFLFASELKAILAAGDVSRELDLIAVHEYIAYLWSPAPRTPLRDVRKFAPGEAMIVRGGSIERRWTFYDLPYGLPPLEDSEETLAERVRVTFENAVRRQLVSDVPVGAFLSGGLDSSSIVAMMRKAQPEEPIICYTIGFQGGEGSDAGAPDDLPYARQVAAHLGVDLRVVETGPAMIDQLGRMLWHLDEPQGDPAPINSMLIADAAQRDGIKVLMSGSGGDDIFSGYRRHTAVRYERAWSWLPAAARKRVAERARAIASGSARGRWMESSLGRRAAKTLSHVDATDDARLASYFQWGTEDLRRALYAPAFAEAVRDHDTAAPLLASLARIPNERDMLNRMLYLEGKHFLADHNLNYTDKTTMAAGVESRVPFLDPELVALAARIPSRMKQKGRVGKSILKKAMEPLLPHTVIYRPKTGFGAPIRRWLKVELRDLVDEMLAADALRRRGLFDPAAVQRLIALDREGRIDGAYTIFALLCIEMWCRLFVDAPLAVPEYAMNDRA
jgi:asparagine synthase (glutamine-hydrolysing)